MSKENDYDSEDDDLPELDSVSSSEYELEEKLEVGKEAGGGEETKEEKSIVVEDSREANDAENDRMRTIKETIEMLDLEGKGNKPQPDWVKSIDLQQYNGLAVVTIPGTALTRTTEYASRWLKYADKRSSAIKAYLLSPFLYGHAHQSDRWLDWCTYGKLLKQSSNYNTQALSRVELVVVEALEIAANECLAMLEDDTNMKSKMEDVYNQSEKILNFYQMLRIVEETEWLRLLVKKITPNADEKDKEELQPNGFNAVAFCTVIHVYEYMFKRSDLPDFLDEFEEQCINDEKDSEELKLKGNELFQTGKFAEAIACYSEAIVLYPFNAFLYSNRAACYLRSKDFAAALSDGYRAIVLRREWYKGYARYVEALAHTNNKRATALCKELTTSKFKDPADVDQLQAALQKPKEKETPPATTSAAKAPSAAKKASTANKISNATTAPTVAATTDTTTNKDSVKKTESRAGAASSKKSATVTAKHTEKKETAKETHCKQATKESAAKEASKDTVKDLEVNKTLPSDVLEIVTNDGTKEATDDNEPEEPENNSVAIFTSTRTTIKVATAPPSAIEKAVAKVAPPHIVNNNKKMQDKPTARSEATPSTKSSSTSNKTSSSSSNVNSKTSNSATGSSGSNVSSSSTAKEKDKSKDKERSKKDSESKLSKSDHKLKKNVMFNLQHASRSLLDKNYRNAIKLYETALNEIEKSKTQWHTVMNTSEHNKLMVTIHYCVGIAVWHQRREDYIITAMMHFRTITTRYSSIIFIPAYYHLGLANAALHHYTEALKDVHNGLNHIMRSRSTSIFNYPGLEEVIEESNAHIIETKLRQLKHRCSPKTIVEAYCRYRNCLQYHISTDIVRDDAEFKGYVAISCSERCVTTFHSLCWRKVREENIDLQASDKEQLGEPCITDGCQGVIKAIKHYEGLGRPKIIAQSEPTSEATIKKDVRPSKLNRTKPSSTKKLERITQRRQEKVAEWRLRKEREIMATQTSHDSSVTTQTSVESVNNELRNTTTTPDAADNREDAGTPGDIRKGGLEVRVGKESTQDDAESKLKNKAKKRNKVKQREKEIVLTGFISEHTGISANAEIDESGNVQKSSAWNVNEEAPFSVPPHLRDQHNTFEGLHTTGGGAPLPGGSTPEVGVAMNSAEADNLLSYFVEIMDKHGPMEISDERLIGQLTILPENSQALIQNFGGLEKFLLSSTAFVKQDGLICLAEYAAVVAASMNSNEDLPTSSLDSSSSLMLQSSREEELQDYNNTYRPRQKGIARVNKDPIVAPRKTSSTINGVAHNKPLCTNSSKNEMGIKKNSTMPQQASRQGIHTPTPPPGFASNSVLGKPSYINKSPYMHSNSNENSLEVAGKTMTNNAKYRNGKESLSSVSSSLDPIDNSLTFSSAKKVSGPLNSTSTEHSQEGPSGEDDALIGNLFDYNAFGTGSSGNYLSPSNEGYFPNAYPQEQVDSSSFLSEITMPPAVDTDVKSKPGFGKKSSASMLESAITASNIMDSNDNTKLLTSGLDMKAAKYASTSRGNTSIPYTSGGHHMEPVYLPPPPPIQQPKVTVDKKDACVETDEVFIYYENYKEKYETAVRSHGEVLKRLEESEDRRVQMNKSHAIEQEQAIRRVQESTKKECQQEIESYKEQMSEESRKYMAEKRELQEAMKSFKIEIKSLNEKSEKLKKDLHAKTVESQNNFIRYQADMESAHKEKKKAEDRLKIAMDVQQQSLQRAMDAEIQMLTMMREFTVKEVDRRIIECDSICSRLPAGSDVQKEWLMYKENMKATVEQYKTSVESHIEEVKQGKTLSSLGPLKITPPQPPQLPFAVGPSTGVQAQAPPTQAPAAMYQMVPQQQMAQGQNIRAQMQPPPQAAAAAMQTGYQIRPSYHMTQQGMAASVATPSQQWGNIMEQQVTQPVMQQQEMGDVKNFPPQQQFQQEVQNGMTVGGAANQQNAADNTPKQQSSFERIVERLSMEYPTYSRDEFKAVLKQVREQQGRLTNRSMDSIMQQMREVINAKETAGASNSMSTQPTSQQQQIATPTTVGSSESPTPSNNTGKVATPKKQPAEKVTVRTLPKKQGPRYLVPPQITPPRKPNLNPAYFPVYEDDNECIICQEDMKDSNSLKLQCGHRFHKACINSWFKEQSTCPTCRRHALLPEEYPVLGQ